MEVLDWEFVRTLLIWVPVVYLAMFIYIVVELLNAEESSEEKEME